MGGTLDAQATYFTCVIVDAVLLQKVLFCLDAVLKKKPAQEFHLGWGAALPNKLVVLTHDPVEKTALYSTEELSLPAPSS
jgi:hypothetical protein